MKIYFSQFGALFSLNRGDAVKLAKDALEGGSYSFSDYKSFKQIKIGRELKRHEHSSFKYGAKFIDVNFCLDWTKEEWKYFLESV